MRIHLLKLTIIVSLGAMFAIYSLNGSPAGAFSGGPQPSVTGAPGEVTCSSCHGGGATGGTLSISGLPANYSPNQEITLTVTLAQQNRVRYGFQLTAIDDSGKQAGDLLPNNDGRTQTQPGSVSGNQRQYINHTSAGNAPSSPGQGSWVFRWRAPAQSAGRVTFYIAGNAANGNFTTSGDTIYTINQSTQPAPALSNFASVSAASFAPMVPIAANSIVAGFGTNLATSGPPATTIPLPTQLGGAEVRVRDTSGMERLAGLFFAGSGQINYMVPARTANGAATITVRRDGVDTAQGTVTIEMVSPGLFSANASGRDAAAAVVFRRRGAVDTFETAVQFNSMTSRFDPLPIDLGPEGDLVALIQFGTGFRSATMATATIGGTPAQVIFIGEAPGFVGLDQANIIIPRSLIGRGLVDVVLIVDGKTANTVQINIK
ncbi:MAG: choice-of-anchor V domain-containing protein [Blastocatellia bacterium]